MVNESSIGKKILQLDHFIYTHAGNCHDYVTLRSPGLYNTRDKKVSDTWLAVFKPTSAFGSNELWEYYSKPLQKKLVIPDVAGYNIYLFAEGAKDECGRSAVHRHSVLVPRDINVELEKMPFITREMTHEKFRKTGNIWDDLYEARNKSIELLEIEVE